MSKPDQTPARAEPSYSKAQAGVKKGKSQNGPLSTSVSVPSTVTKPPQQYAETEDGDESVEQLKGNDEIGENDEGDEQGSTAEGQDNDGQEEKLICAEWASKPQNTLIPKGTEILKPGSNEPNFTWK